jgi:hypothetical protein
MISKEGGKEGKTLIDEPFI